MALSALPSFLVVDVLKKIEPQSVLKFTRTNRSLYNFIEQNCFYLHYQTNLLLEIHIKKDGKLLLKISNASCKELFFKGELQLETFKNLYAPFLSLFHFSSITRGGELSDNCIWSEVLSSISGITCTRFSAAAPLCIQQTIVVLKPTELHLSRVSNLSTLLTPSSVDQMDYIYIGSGYHDQTYFLRTYVRKVKEVRMICVYKEGLYPALKKLIRDVYNRNVRNQKLSLTIDSDDPLPTLDIYDLCDFSRETKIYQTGHINIIFTPMPSPCLYLTIVISYTSIVQEFKYEIISSLDGFIKFMDNYFSVFSLKEGLFNSMMQKIKSEMFIN